MPIVEIKGKRYLAEQSGPDARLAELKDDGPYVVSRAADGSIECTCPDFRYRHAGKGTRCKHGEAIEAAGLLAP